jgi:DNA processing protein
VADDDPEAADRALIERLELHGTLPPRPRAAIVGARAAHLRFRDLVPVCVRALARCGVALVSGGALGIDGDAHRAALELGLPQVAVLPCGPDRAYPPAHADLFAAMLRAGSGVLYTQPRDREPTRAMFVSRNRHVVALCDAVLVVEAERPSGTLHTGRLALRGGLAVGAITGSRGAADLVSRGATRFPAEPDALEGALDHWLVDRTPPAAEWPLHLLWLRDALSCAGPAGLRADALPDPQATSLALVEAELGGLVVEGPPGTWRAVGRD